MSKLVDHINTYQTGKRFYEIGPVSIQEEVSIFEPMPYINEYRVSVELATSFQSSSTEHLVQQQRVAKQQIEEVVFGEFRPLLLEIIQSAYGRDYEGVVKNAEQILNTMFKGGY